MNITILRSLEYRMYQRGVPPIKFDPDANKVNPRSTTEREEVVRIARQYGIRVKKLMESKGCPKAKNY